MALLAVRKFTDTILELPQPEGELEQWNQVFEPEFHQERYVNACKDAAGVSGAFQLGNPGIVQKYPYRGIQPVYADDEDDPGSLEFDGMISRAGKVLDGANG